MEIDDRPRADRREQRLDDGVSVLAIMVVRMSRRQNDGVEADRARDLEDGHVATEARRTKHSRACAENGSNHPIRFDELMPHPAATHLVEPGMSHRVVTDLVALPGYSTEDPFATSNSLTDHEEGRTGAGIA